MVLSVKVRLAALAGVVTLAEDLGAVRVAAFYRRTQPLCERDEGFPFRRKALQRGRTLGLQSFEAQVREPLAIQSLPTFPILMRFGSEFIGHSFLLQERLFPAVTEYRDKYPHHAFPFTGVL